MIYSVEIINAINPQIKVGCVCDSGEFSELSNSLNNPSFSLNGQSPNFIMERIEPDDIGGNPELSFNFDVIVVMDHDITHTRAYNYLEQEGGIIEIRDLDMSLAAGVSEMANVHNWLFGITWASALDDPDGSGIEFGGAAIFPNSSYYNIYYYFYKIFTIDFGPGFCFCFCFGFIHRK